MRLTGKCNCCGLCCVSLLGNKCENLRVTLFLGVPNGTYCAKYDVRYNGMPINMVDSTGAVVEVDHVCAKDSMLETLSILQRGIGKGCSLEVVDG